MTTPEQASTPARSLALPTVLNILVVLVSVVDLLTERATWASEGDRRAAHDALGSVRAEIDSMDVPTGTEPPA